MVGLELGLTVVVGETLGIVLGITLGLSLGSCRQVLQVAEHPVQNEMLIPSSTTVVPLELIATISIL